MRNVQSQLFETGAALSPTQLNRAKKDVVDALNDLVAQRYVRSTASFRLGPLTQADGVGYREVRLRPPYELRLDAIRFYLKNQTTVASGIIVTISATNIDGWEDLVLEEEDLIGGQEQVFGVFRDMRIPANTSVTLTVTVTGAATWSFDMFDVEFDVICDRIKGVAPVTDILAPEKAGTAVSANINAFDAARAAAEAADASVDNNRLIRMMVFDFGRDFTLTSGQNDAIPVLTAPEGLKVYRATAHILTTTSTCTIQLQDEAAVNKLSFSQVVNAALGELVGNISTGIDALVAAAEDNTTEDWAVKMTAPAATLVERAYVILYVGEE